MFYNTEILTKRGPLARVWMASHLSTKLTKTNLLATSIPSSVTSILGEALLPMALRLSGQLLLGVARIYSRKAKYLLDDCNETLSKVKKAFRPGQVDMEEVDTGARGGAGGITLGLQEGGLEDILNQYDYGGNQWDFANIQAAPAATNKKAGKANISNKADITLPDHSMAWDDNYGAFGDFDNGIDGGIDSQVDGFFDEEFELGILDDEGEVLDFDEEGMPIESGKKRGREEDGEELRSEGDMSVEAGRHASVHASERGSVGPFELAGEFGKDAEGDVDMGGMDQEFGGDWNVEFDMGGGGEEFPDVNPDREQTPAAPSLNGDLDESLGLTPKTAADLAKKKDQPNPSKKPKLRKQVVDAVTELEWQAGRNNSVRFKEPSYLPSSRLHLRLLELESDPSNYLPKASTSANTELFAPLGLASELENLYALPTRRQRIKLEGRELAKPAVAAAAGQDDVELGRERQESLGMDMGEFGDFGMEHEMGGGGGAEDLGGWDGGEFEAGGGFEGEGFQFDLGGEGEGARDREATPKASASQAARKKQKIHGSAGGSKYLFDEEAVGGVSQGPLAIFDVASAAAQASQAQQASTQAQSLAAQEEEDVVAGGAPRIKWSKNTKKAIKVLQDELAPVDEEEVAQEEPKKMQFEKVAQKATRRAASSFFFELLVLSTRECVRIEQPDAYGSIEVQAKEKLWDTVVAEEPETQSQAIEA